MITSWPRPRRSATLLPTYTLPASISQIPSSHPTTRRVDKMQKDDIVTAKFRVQIPCVLQSISPSLAALHATRARLLHHPGPETDVLKDTNCTKCGAYLLDGTGSIRTIRKTRSFKGKQRPKGPLPYARFLRRSCRYCGCEEDLPMETVKEVALQANRAPMAAPTPALASAASTPTPTQSRSTSVIPPRTSSAAPSPPSTRQPSAAPSTLSTLAHTSSLSSKAPTPSKPSPATSPAPTALDARAKPRAKKKTGLQDMLARNRERQEQEKKASSGGGLAAFLEGL